MISPASFLVKAWGRVVEGSRSGSSKRARSPSGSSPSSGGHTPFSVGVAGGLLLRHVVLSLGQVCGAQVTSLASIRSHVLEICLRTGDFVGWIVWEYPWNW